MRACVSAWRRCVTAAIVASTAWRVRCAATTARRFSCDVGPAAGDARFGDLLGECRGSRRFGDVCAGERDGERGGERAGDGPGAVNSARGGDRGAGASDGSARSRNANCPAAMSSGQSLAAGGAQAATGMDDGARRALLLRTADFATEFATFLTAAPRRSALLERPAAFAFCGSCCVFDDLASVGASSRVRQTP